MALNDVTYTGITTNLTTGFTTLWTVPASQRVLKLGLWISNTTNSGQDFDLIALPSAGATASAAHYFRPIRAGSGTTLGNGDTEDIEKNAYYPAGTTIQGRADTAGVVAVHLFAATKEET